MNAQDATGAAGPVRPVLSNARIIAFFRAALTMVYPPRSIKEVCERLTTGTTLQKVRKNYEAEGIQFDLQVKKMGKGHYEIEFGLRGPATGEGGTWHVAFTRSGEVKSIEQPRFWTY